MVFILRLFSILTLLIIKIEFWYQKSLFNFYIRQISDRFYMIKQSQITSFSLVIHVIKLKLKLTPFDIAHHSKGNPFQVCLTVST